MWKHSSIFIFVSYLVKLPDSFLLIRQVLHVLNNIVGAIHKARPCGTPVQFCPFMLQKDQLMVTVGEMEGGSGSGRLTGGSGPCPRGGAWSKGVRRRRRKDKTGVVKGEQEREKKEEEEETAAAHGGSGGGLPAAACGGLPFSCLVPVTCKSGGRAFSACSM